MLPYAYGMSKRPYLRKSGEILQVFLRFRMKKFNRFSFVACFSARIRHFSSRFANRLTTADRIACDLCTYRQSFQRSPSVTKVKTPAVANASPVTEIGLLLSSTEGGGRLMCLISQITLKTDLQEVFSLLTVRSFRCCAGE